MADAKKPEVKPAGLDFNAIAAKLKEQAKGEHIDEITDRLSESYLSYKKSIGNKRKLDNTQAEALAHKLYDTLTDYMVSEHYMISPEDAKKLKGGKSKHGKLLDDLVSNAFKINRDALVNGLKERSDSGKHFSSDYIKQIMKKSMDEYNNHIQGHILGKLSNKDVDSLRKQISSYIEKHKLDKDDFKQVLKPSSEFGEVLQTYAQLASQYHLAEEPKKPK